MEVLFTSIARAGGVEIPAGKRIFQQKAAPAVAADFDRAPGQLKSSLGRLLRGAGNAISTLGERLGAPTRGVPMKIETCR